MKYPKVADLVADDTVTLTGNPRRRARRNPASPEVREAAVAKFREFHRYEPKKVTDFPRGFKIPTEMVCVGPAKHTMYRSGKVDPSTLKKPKRPIDYIHQHDAGVKYYMAPDDEDLDELEIESDHVAIPRSFAQAEALVKLGESIGGAFEVDGEQVDFEAVSPLPELYCTTDGKCLLVIQDRREVLAMIYGGALGVFGRGIDG